ncbi:CAMPATH-1 antigen [Nannospalax galili]|uniref:CAMPATH-1 antigen n=1 Tax=Nannospalax galili TaxID=1026970 RepID=A0A8C6RHB2_NANGA|nr:CAMPATH-1 antigen [Nannospalax galili]
MNSFLFLLTISLLVIVQLQTGVLGSQNATEKAVTTVKIITHSRTRETVMNSGASALSDVGGGSFLFFLANTLFFFFYLS